MIEIWNNLFIGNEQDYESYVKMKEGWTVVHACKEPYHRSLLGYTGRGAPKDHSEYLIARRDNQLFLNIVDANSPEYIPKDIINAALIFIDESLSEGNPCLVHCNLGESRSPSIGFLYMVSKKLLPTNDLALAEEEFIRLYPKYNPKSGIREFIIMYWNEYVK